MKKTASVGFADFAVERRKIKSEFFDQVNKVVDWQPISRLIDAHYLKGTSAPAHLPIMVCCSSRWGSCRPGTG